MKMIDIVAALHYGIHTYDLLFTLSQFYCIALRCDICCLVYFHAGVSNQNVLGTVIHPVSAVYI